jgi:hypothetical protein
MPTSWTFTVNGANFQSGLTVTVSPAGQPSTIVSGAQIQNVTSGSFQVTIPTVGEVFVPPSGGLNAFYSLQSGIQVNNPDGGTSSVVGVIMGQTETTTTTGAQIVTTNTTNATQTVNTYSVELKARMQGGAYLFDQTYTVAFTDPSFVAHITQAKSVLTNAGAVSFTGPTQLSSAQTLVSSVVNTVQTGSTSTQVIVGADVFIGPAILTVGTRGVCQGYTLDANNHATLSGCTLPGSLFGLFPGDQDIDTTGVNLTTNSQTATTTNTTLTSQVYEIDGFVAGASPLATPAPPSLILGFLGLAGLGVYAARSRLRRA